MTYKSMFFTVGALALLAGACADAPLDVDKVSISKAAVGDPTVVLGQRLYGDRWLSINRNQSCATCHQPKQGFAAPLLTAVTQGSVVQGSVAGKFGGRKPPTAAYATISPIFSGGGNPSGGNFWDGRATGTVLGNPAADQAAGPFLNPVEQAMPDAACVVYRVKNGAYVDLFTAAWGNDILSIVWPANTESICTTPVETAGEYVALSAADRVKVRTAYNNIALSIADFESTLNRYSSRFDAGTLTALELQGQALFSGKGKCQQCHTAGVGAAFTDFRYHNLGVPKNPNNPVFNYTSGLSDVGLGGFTGDSKHMGKFKTPTARNVGMGNNRTYMHNGVFTSLRQVVDFYNTRDALPVCTPAQIATLHPSEYGSYDPDKSGPLTAAKCWPPAEHATNLDTQRLGDLGMTKAEVNALVAFLKALSDQ